MAGRSLDHKFTLVKYTVEAKKLETQQPQSGESQHYLPVIRFPTFWGLPGLLSNQGERSHNGPFKKKVLKYGTPKPSYYTCLTNLNDKPLEVTCWKSCFTKIAGASILGGSWDLVRLKIR